VLRSRELTHVVAAVVRYFGGTKLGIPGLIEAYREATVAALAGAIIVERDVLVRCTIEFPFDRIGEVMRLVKQWNGTPGAPDFTGSTARLEVYLPQSQHPGAASSLAPLAASGVRASFQQAPL
jgi:putative IMPACT (imprinted ancient) family translation regulator